VSLVANKKVVAAVSMKHEVETPPEGKSRCEELKGEEPWVSLTANKEVVAAASMKHEVEIPHLKQVGNFQFHQTQYHEARNPRRNERARHPSFTIAVEQPMGCNAIEEPMGSNGTRGTQKLRTSNRKKCYQIP